ncbi:TauD/TfdA family dioxygenase [Arthrobacter sp. R1-13]
MQLEQRGIVLFRGFDQISPSVFQQCVEAVSGQTLDYEFRSNQRTRVDGNVFSSTDFPPNELIPFHNEMSYFVKWPKHLWFSCETPAAEGGATLFADSASVLDALPENVVAAFESGVRYQRNLSSSVDVSWEEAFGTTDRLQVEEYCRANSIDFAWIGGSLRTVQDRPAIVRDRSTGRPIWFNQAHLFHHSSFGPDVARVLERTYAMKELPRTALHRDGSAIEPSMLDAVRKAYSDNSFAVRWQAGDVLVLDNVRYAHAREPYTPPRKLSVAMAGDGPASVEY